ncbi:MAG: glutamate synthase-related protein [bacterium]
MPVKYFIHTTHTPPRYRPVGKLGIVDWREDCSSCHNCVKRSCVYGFYRDELDCLRDERGYLDYIYQCNGCLVCVQECTKNILTRTVNPEYELLGDEYYTPEIILSTWYQSETGCIPVSGAGYGGKFTGSGFNSMWTDMSEIVRPTRDGIHGREYINTSVDIGRKLNHLSFQDKELASTPPPRIESPMPLLFDCIPEYYHRGAVLEGIVQAASRMNLFTILRQKDISGLRVEGKKIIPLIESSDACKNDLFADAPMIIFYDSDDVMTTIKARKRQNPDQIIAIRLPATPTAHKRMRALAHEGAEVINIEFDKHGKEKAASNPRHMRDVLRQIHGDLTKEGIRDEITLIASGGIALPEYMAKAVICGADLIGIDLPLLIALECRLCNECAHGQRCQIKLEEIDASYAVSRITNLIAAWRNQLLEMLGAMGIREVRRLRGETGRCMFFEDLEEETFAPLFGKRRAQNNDARRGMV